MTINSWGTFLVGAETAYGTVLSTLAGSVNGLRLINKPVPTIDADNNDLDATMFHGQFGPADEGKPGQISFSTDVEFNVRPEGANTVAPSWGPIMRAASFSETTADSATTYAPITSSQESCCIQINHGATLQQQILGNITETLTFSGEAGKPIVASASLRGLYANRTDAGADANVEDAYHDSRYPIMTSGTMTVDTISETSLLVHSFTCTIENTYATVGSLAAAYGINSFQITDQKISVEIVFNAVSVATWLTMTKYLAGTAFAWFLQIGAAQSYVKFSGNAKHLTPQLSIDEERLVETANLVCVPTAGNLNDHFKLELGTPA